jgi:anti-sigma B factor antagonist
MPETMYPFQMAGGVPVVTAPAEIDTTTAGELRAILAEWHGRGHAAVVMDMTGTEFCDSAGLRELVRAHKRAAADGGGLRLVTRAEGAFLRIFTLTGLDGIIPRFATVPQALAEGPAAAIRPRRRGLAPESPPVPAGSPHVAATCPAEHGCEHESTHGPTLAGPGGHGLP